MTGAGEAIARAFSPLKLWGSREHMQGNNGQTETPLLTRADTARCRNNDRRALLARRAAGLAGDWEGKASVRTADFAGSALTSFPLIAETERLEIDCISKCRSFY